VGVVAEVVAEVVAVAATVLVLQVVARDQPLDHAA